MEKEPQPRVSSVADPPLPELPPWPGQAIQVASVPFSDPYVDAVLPDDVVRVGPSGEPSPWLESWHLVAHTQDIDVVHLHVGSHVGMTHLSPAELECWTENVRRLDVPLVVTVHDVPIAGTADHTRLAAVLETAEVVLTLTPGAADEIAERFGRTAIVVACPSLVAPDPALGAERGLVGVRLRPGTAAGPEAVELVRAALCGALSGGGRLRVLVDALDEPGAEIAKLAERGEVDQVRCGPLDRPAQLQQLHVAVLPEPRGAHSRDLEVCRDVGTRVVAPRGGWFTEQWSDVVPYGTDDDGAPDPVSLAASVSAALTAPMPRPADRNWRREQAAAVARVHRDVYAQVVGDHLELTDYTVSSTVRSSCPPSGRVAS